MELPRRVVRAVEAAWGVSGKKREGGRAGRGGKGELRASRLGSLSCPELDLELLQLFHRPDLQYGRTSAAFSFLREAKRSRIRLKSSRNLTTRLEEGSEERTSWCELHLPCHELHKRKNRSRTYAKAFSCFADIISFLASES